MIFYDAKRDPKEKFFWVVDDESRMIFFGFFVSVFAERLCQLFRAIASERFPLCARLDSNLHKLIR
jgi:hypothetical protein